MSLSVSSCKAVWLQQTCIPSPVQSCWGDDGADQHLLGLRAVIAVVRACGSKQVLQGERLVSQLQKHSLAVG